MYNQSREVKINDVTLREGDQAPLTSFNKKEKQIIALMLNELGVDCMEVGFGASRADFENIRGVIDMFETSTSQVKISSLGRAVGGDTEASLEALKGYKYPRIHIFIATPDNHIESKFQSKGKNIQERRAWVLGQIKDEITKAKKYKDEINPHLEIEFSPEAASDSAINNEKILDFESDQFQFLITSLETAIRAGASILNVPDTVGNLTHNETEYFFEEISQRLAFLKTEGYTYEFSCHIHNDIALASANAISSLRGGVTWIETTIAGIGERAGNTILSDIVGIIGEKSKSILTKSQYDGKNITLPNINTQLIGPVTRFVEKILNLNKSLQTPFIGALSDKDGSGVHNASSQVYGGSKDKNKYGGQETEEFFSPRGGATQIIRMLEKYNIYEEKMSAIIQEVTTIACHLAEETKELYACNIFIIYLIQKGLFKIHDIQIHGAKIEITFELQGKIITLTGEGKGENGLINGLIIAINNALGENIVDIIDIKIINKPSLSQAIEGFYEELNNNKTPISNFFKENIQTLLDNKDECSHSKQRGIAHITLKVSGKEVNSVSSGNNVDQEIIKAILYASMSEFM